MLVAAASEIPNHVIKIVSKKGIRLIVPMEKKSVIVFQKWLPFRSAVDQNVVYSLQCHNVRSRKIEACRFSAVRKT